MPLNQFINSLQQIAADPHTTTLRGTVRHLRWQVRKALRLFPYRQTISKSQIEASHAGCGVSALVNSRGLYDYNNMNLIKLLLRDSGTILDVGANIGSYTLIASEQPAADVHAFEPHPRTFAELRRNVALNGRTNVTLVNAAVADRAGKVQLTNGPTSSTNYVTADSESGGLAVDCITLDDYCAEKRITPLLLKVDVEGHELAVLRGMSRTLDRTGGLFIEMRGLSEIRSEGENAIQDLLRAAGFSGPYMVNFNDRVLFEDRRFSTEDPLFVREPPRQGLLDRGFEIST